LGWTAHEINKIGPDVVGFQIRGKVAILWSRDSFNAINFMPFTSSDPQ
jgi:beta-galactosidase